MLPHPSLPASACLTRPTARRDHQVSGLAPPEASRAARRRPTSLPTWPRSAAGGRLRDWLQRVLFGPLLRLVCRLEIRGQHHLAGLTGPVLLAPNHSSHLDTPVLLAALPRALRRQVAVAAAADYFFRRWAFGAVVGLLLNAFPFERRGGAVTTLRTCQRLTDDGWSLLLFPEGTRSTTGHLGSFRPGIGLLASALDLPVVPVRLSGLEHVLPKGARWPRPGNVVVTFGPPLRVGPDCPAVEATRRIEAAVRALGQET